MENTCRWSEPQRCGPTSVIPTIYSTLSVAFRHVERRRARVSSSYMETLVRAFGGEGGWLGLNKLEHDA